jgi:hypothetical protein
MEVKEAHTVTESVGEVNVNGQQLFSEVSF